MDKSLGIRLHSGAFSNSHRSNPSPHPTNNLGRVYPESFPSFNFVYGGGRENRKKISKRMQCFKREPRNDRKYEYCSTVLRTFVQDCSAVNRTKSNPVGRIVVRLVRQSNIIELELFGEFDYRTQSNQSTSTSENWCCRTGVTGAGNDDKTIFIIWTSQHPAKVTKLFACRWQHNCINWQSQELWTLLVVSDKH